MSEKIYPKGLMCFKPHEKAPDFVLASVIINPNQFFAWMKENASLLKEHEKHGKQLKCQLLSGEKGPYLVVDTFEKSQAQETPGGEIDDLPF